MSPLISSSLPSSALIIGAGVAALLIVAYLLSQGARTRTAGSASIILVGPVGSGKTALFSQLVLGQARPTQTSIAPNIGYALANKFEDGHERTTPVSLISYVTTSQLNSTITDAQKQLRVIDLPGHERLRARLLTQYYASSSSVVLVLDACNGLNGRAIKEACDHLQLVLAVHAATEGLLSLAVFLSKTDLVPDYQSKTPKSIHDKAKFALQREMERRRLAMSSGSNSRVEALSQGEGRLREEAEILATPHAHLNSTWTWESRAANVHFFSGSSVEEGAIVKEELVGWQSR